MRVFTVHFYAQLSQQLQSEISPTAHSISSSLLNMSICGSELLLWKGSVYLYGLRPGAIRLFYLFGNERWQENYLWVKSSTLKQSLVNAGKVVIWRRAQQQS